MCAARPESAGKFCYHPFFNKLWTICSISRHKHPPSLLCVITSFPGRVLGLQGRSIKKHRRSGSGSMGISCFSVDFGIEGWCQPTPNFSSLSDCHPNELARKRFFFFSSASLHPVCACVRVCASASARADRGHSSTCLHSFPLSQPSLRAAVLLKQIGASRLCHSTHHTGCQVWRPRQIKQIKGRSERGNIYGTEGEKVAVNGGRKREKCCRKKEAKK